MHKNQEKGQIVVLLAFVFVLFLGMMALAIDGGMIYSDRRYDQNVVDSSALAGAAGAALIMETNEYSYAEFSCSDPIINDFAIGAKAKAIEYAQTRAVINNVADFDGDISDNHGVRILCVDGDLDGDGASDEMFSDKRLEIEVVLTDEIDTNFVHFFYDGPVTTVVRATTVVRPRRPLAFGNAIVALSTDCDNSMTFTGVGSAGPIEVEGGNVITNGCYNVSGNVVVNVIDANLYYVDPDAQGVDKWVYTSPAPQPISETVPMDDIPTPDCSGFTPDEYFDDPVVGNKNIEKISPGVYPSITIKNGGLLYMESGLYCVDGDFDIGGEVKNKAFDPDEGAAYKASDLVDGVTVYMRSGDFLLSNTGSVMQLYSPRGLDININASLAPALRGMVLFNDPANSTGVIDLSGGSEAFVEGDQLGGTIYSPTGHVDMGGNSDLTGYYQVVAYSITCHGTDKITINYDENVLYTIPNYIDLLE